jgi:hypothetical protein
LYPKPFECDAKPAKFSVVFGTASPNNPKTILPAGLPPIDTSKKTFFVTVKSPACRNKIKYKTSFILYNPFQKSIAV